MTPAHRSPINLTSTSSNPFSPNLIDADAGLSAYFTKKLKYSYTFQRPSFEYYRLETNYGGTPRIIHLAETRTLTPFTPPHDPDANIVQMIVDRVLDQRTRTKELQGIKNFYDYESGSFYCALWAIISPDEKGLCSIVSPCLQEIQLANENIYPAAAAEMAYKIENIMDRFFATFNPKPIQYQLYPDANVPI